MIDDRLPHEEQHALEAIVRHHGIDPRGDGATLTKNLAQLCNWIHMLEQSRFNSQQPPFLLVLLSLMGIYKPEDLNQRKEPTPT